MTPPLLTLPLLTLTLPLRARRGVADPNEAVDAIIDMGNGGLEETIKEDYFLVPGYNDTGGFNYDDPTDSKDKVRLREPPSGGRARARREGSVEASDTAVAVWTLTAGSATRGTRTSGGGRIPCASRAEQCSASTSRLRAAGPPSSVVIAVWRWRWWSAPAQDEDGNADFGAIRIEPPVVGNAPRPSPPPPSPPPPKRPPRPPPNWPPPLQPGANWPPYPRFPTFPPDVAPPPPEDDDMVRADPPCAPETARGPSARGRPSYSRRTPPWPAPPTVRGSRSARRA